MRKQHRQLREYIFMQIVQRKDSASFKAAMSICSSGSSKRMKIRRDSPGHRPLVALGIPSQ